MVGVVVVVVVVAVDVSVVEVEIDLLLLLGISNHFILSVRWIMGAMFALLLSS
jgi:hypothetical protein